MKIILSIISFLLFESFGFSQPDSSNKEYTLIETFTEESLSVYIGRQYERRENKLEKLPGFYDIMLINTSTEIPDTLIIDKSEWIYPDLDSVYVRLIELGKSGLNGVLFTIMTKETSNIGENGSYSWIKTVNEIWDIKGREKIFSTTSKYNYWGEYLHWDDSSSYSSTTNYFFEYDMVFTSRNEIIIKDLKSNLDVLEDKSTKNEYGIPYYCECLTPEHKEGTYVYMNGRYDLITK